MKQIFFRGTLLIALSFMMAACAPYHRAQSNINDTIQEMHEKDLDSEKNRVVRDEEGFYVDSDPIKLSHLPRWLEKPIDLHARQMPLQLLVNQVIGDSEIISTYDNKVNSDIPVNLSYKGTVKGALDAIKAKTGYNYEIDGSKLIWSIFQTKIFNISFMPGNSTYSVGQSQSSNKNASSSSSGSSGGANSNSGSQALQDDQYSKLEGQLSIWKDLRTTLDQLKSSTGKVVVSESTTTVTVRDYPSNVQAIGSYIAKLNKVLGKQVMISVQVLEVDLNHDFNLGLDWNLLFKVANKSYSLTGNPGSATNVSSTLATSATSPGMSFHGDNNSVILNALSKQGRVRVVTRPTVVTMNNQIASIRITQDTGYLQSVTTTSTAQVGSQTALNPGVVTDGFTLYLLPKIQDNRVYLQISSTIASLISLQKESSAPTGSSTSGSNYQAIEVPTLAQKIFNQRSLIRSGSTLVIAGYKRLRDETQQADFYGIGALGGKGSQSQNVETLVLITPTILKSDR